MSTDNDWESRFCAFRCKIQEFFLADKYTDVNIVCQNKLFKCHRLILAAASEYFDIMFYGNFKEGRLDEVPLHDISVKAFEEVLRFAYEAHVQITDDNVYDLLRASEMLRLNFIESECVRYLTEENMPINNAVEIFLFACATQKSELIKTSARFILKHLDHFFNRNEILKIPFEELSTLLPHFRDSPVKNERAVLNAIFQWVSHLSIANNDKKQMIAQLTKRVEFVNISAEYIAEYYERNESLDIGMINLPGLYSNDSYSSSTLHAYIEGKQGNKRCTHIFTLKKYNEDSNWILVDKLNTDDVYRMNIVTLNNRLYCLKAQRNTHEKFSFCSYSSVNLSTDTKLLKLPPIDLNGTLRNHMCCDERSVIYLNCSAKNSEFSGLFLYNCEVDDWSPIFALDNEIIYSTMTCCNGRLYVIGGETSQYLSNYIPGSSRFRAYDHRAGKCEELKASNMRHTACSGCCAYDGKIYVSTNDAVEIYNPVAGKWDIMKCRRLTNDHRLLSYENKLWIFENNFSDKLSSYTNDLIFQKWSISKALNDAVDQARITCRQMLEVTTF